MDKLILDACCGGRMFWFNKHQPNTLYIDIREADKGHEHHRPNHEVKPDIIMDFRELKFPDKSFKMVVWDPPHLIKLGKTSRMAKVFGTLNAETWPYDFKTGFSECWRVLDDYGVLIFKWGCRDISLKDILKLFPVEPLFGHPASSSNNSYWCCFMKIPKQEGMED